MVLRIMLLDLKSLSNTSVHVKEDFRKGKDGFYLGLNRQSEEKIIQMLNIVVASTKNLVNTMSITGKPD
jgi:hypothetical protein